MNRRAPREKDYEVGYRRPPKATRFKPGQSGNPRGRAKRSKNGRTLLEHALNETVLVSENGASQRITRREAFFKTLVARALKEPRSAALLIKIMEQYDLVKEEQTPRSMVIEFVRAKQQDDNKEPGRT